MQVLERGWLSANNIVFTGPEGTALVDSGYCTHAPQTLALVRAALASGGNGSGSDFDAAARPLDRLLNTHLHSDHCGGNAALQAAWPALDVAIPAGDAQAVADWNESALTFAATGQQCPRFRHHRLLVPGGVERLGGCDWQVHAAPGHDPHSMLLFEPQSRTLISADALWADGFGVVFPELEGEHAFAAVAATLDVIAALAPATVIPGHGAVFTDVAGALATARRRLHGFVADPRRHALYAAKVLLKFKLLEWQRVALPTLNAWAAATPYLGLVHRRHFADATPFAPWVVSLVQALVASGAARQLPDGTLLNA